MDGISDIIRDIDRPLCVASNSSLYRLTRSLGRTDLWMAFRGQIFSADQVAKPKPAPDLLLHCAREMKADPSRSIMIDDGTHGILAAVAAGMPSIGFVDPNDPRPNRASALMSAGAQHVAVGAAELRDCLQILASQLHR
jgi:beta-phosphoglucomutase-like phosphatase (HAD superfamily)